MSFTIIHLKNWRKDVLYLSVPDIGYSNWDIDVLDAIIPSNKIEKISISMTYFEQDNNRNRWKIHGWYLWYFFFVDKSNMYLVFSCS